jgi:hypothetical protein
MQKPIKAKITQQPPKAPKKPQPRKAVFEDSKDSDSNKNAVAKAPASKPTPREFSAGECNLLEQMSTAATEGAYQTAEKEAEKAALAAEQNQESQAALDIEEQEILAAFAEDDGVKTPLFLKFPSDDEYQASPTFAPTPKHKRKASQLDSENDLPTTKKSRTHNSADIVIDSDEEADYTLPTAPTLELPEQREGWAFTEALSTESVKVV